MGDFNYSLNEVTKNGMHSITFESDNSKYNTWSSFKMAPQSRPFVAAPPVKEEYIDVPGADGALDYTEVLTGKARYGRRTGSWNFLIDSDAENWPDLYSKLLNTFHGKEYKVILDDDPGYYYQGRLSITGQFSNKDYSSVTFGYNLEPYKWPIGTTAGENWKWNPLFDQHITIYFGTFSVNGQKARNILNEQDTVVTANFNVTNPITIYNFKNFNDDVTDPQNGVSSVNTLVASGLERSEARIYCLLNSGFNSVFCTPTYTATGDNAIELQPGDNDFYFVGNGIVSVEYSRGKTL